MSRTTDHFDLLRESWIPVVSHQGGTLNVGILPLLREAQAFSHVADWSPVVTFGIYRVLAAVVQTYLPLEDRDAWGRAWNHGAFDEAFLTRVEAGCSGKMRLFDAERPFYQTADIRLDGKPAEPLKSIGYLAPEVPTGTNVAHFDHGGEATHAFCPTCCAKGLVHLPVFALAGGAGIKPGINGVPPLYVLPRGENLFLTLLLNFVQRRPAVARPDDPGPLWETVGKIEARKEKTTTGFVESLTWPARRVRLFPGPGGECSRCGADASVLVRKMVFAQGWSRVREVAPWKDPWAPYVARKAPGAGQAELLPLRPNEHRDLWRDFPSLFLKEEVGQSSRPSLLDEIEDREADGTLPTRTSISHEVFGLRTDMKAKIFEWKQDTFQFPPRLLRSRPAARAIREALEYAAHADNAIRSSLKLLFTSTPDLRAFAARTRAGEKLVIPKAEVSAMDPVVYRARRSFWSSLEPRFRAIISDSRLEGNDQTGFAKWGEEWRQVTRTAARGALNDVLLTYDGDAESALRQVSARTVFGIVIATQKGGPA